MAENTQVVPDTKVEEWLPKEFSTTIVMPTPETHVSILDDTAILLNLDTGAYHALNPVGTTIWEQFSSDQTLDVIHRAICERYEVTENTARQDLVELVSRLYYAGLIQFEKRSMS